MIAEAAKAKSGTDAASAAASQVKPAEEKQTNCLGCGKPIKKLKRYYRNGKYYCTKKCWRKSLKEKKEKEAAK